MTLREELTREFPNGGVGMVVHVDDQTYSIFRYFNAYKEGLAEVGSDLESLIANGNGQTSYKEFEGFLATEMMSKVSPSAIPETEQAIEWRHLLAWLTRDQGARFKSFFAWREGEGIGFQRARQDPPIVMRAVLGLLNQEESELLVRIHSFEQELKRSQQETERLKQEPNLIRRRIESELRAWLQVGDDLPLRSDDLFKESVEDKVNDARQKAQARLAEANIELNRSNDQLFKLRLELTELERQYQLAEQEFDLFDEAKAQNDRTAQRISNRCEILQTRLGTCIEANIPFQNCTHIKDEIKQLQGTISLKGHRDKKLLQENEKYWTERTDNALAGMELLKPQLASIKSRIDSLEQISSSNQTRRDTALIDVNRATRLLEELERWEKVYGSPESGESIRQSEQNTKKLIDQVGFASVRLKLSQAERSNRQKRLDELMNALVQHLFSDTTAGSFVIRDEYFPFQLSVNGGEAYYVLEVLLGDLACLLDSTDSGSAFPGFLIHDCPREADMSPVLYEKLLSLMLQIEQQAYSGEIPYQYIVTTTSPPPAELRNAPFLRETLDPSTDDGLLFRKRFKIERQKNFF
ncbi:hypothetical protein [Methylomonas sp. ZR1]|uniref:hypothetical protein n=1 Tax=Methylomonas sp. ZR1 TaxID=1797072 RepID=UPI0014914298|nr:hypothetical protein [Methylomonas sp. ZR1]